MYAISQSERIYVQIIIKQNFVSIISTYLTQLYTLKPVYLEHVDNRFLKLDLYYLNGHVFKNLLSICLR